MKPRNLLSSSLANLAKYIYPFIGTSSTAAKKQNTASILANTYASVVTPLNVLCEQLQDRPALWLFHHLSAGVGSRHGRGNRTPGQLKQELWIGLVVAGRGDLLPMSGGHGVGTPTEGSTGKGSAFNFPS